MHEELKTKKLLMKFLSKRSKLLILILKIKFLIYKYKHIIMIPGVIEATRKFNDINEVQSWYEIISTNPIILFLSHRVQTYMYEIEFIQHVPIQLNVCIPRVDNKAWCVGKHRLDSTTNEVLLLLLRWYCTPLRLLLYKD